MSSLGTIAITAAALMIALAPRAIDAWLARREDALASRDEASLELAAGGAE